MELRGKIWRLGMGLICVSALYAFTKPFRVYISMEGYDNIPIPADADEKAEWVFGRLMYPQHPYARFARYRWGRLDWREGGTSWSQDYPRADRHFAAALRRLTRIHTRSVEQPVNPDDTDDIYDWPWLCAGEMGDWKLTRTQAATLREFLLRGGFLMLDDWWGPDEWDRFMESMQEVFPDRPILEIEDGDAIFHSVYNLDDRYRIPGMWGIRGQQRGRSEGAVAHWRGIYDDKGRLMVAMTYNNDVGDSWEWADDPRYPEKFSALGIRLGVNFVVYSMTH
jgi:hypothetical protein